MKLCVCVCVCVRACVRACVRVCVRACARARARVHMYVVALAEGCLECVLVLCKGGNSTKKYIITVIIIIIYLSHRRYMCMCFLFVYFLFCRRVGGVFHLGILFNVQFYLFPVYHKLAMRLAVRLVVEILVAVYPRVGLYMLLPNLPREAYNTAIAMRAFSLF